MGWPDRAHARTLRRIAETVESAGPGFRNKDDNNSIGTSSDRPPGGPLYAVSNKESACWRAFGFEREAVAMVPVSWKTEQTFQIFRYRGQSREHTVPNVSMERFSCEGLAAADDEEVRQMVLEL